MPPKTQPASPMQGGTVHIQPFSDLRTHCDALCKFGDSHFIMQKIARKAGQASV